MYRGGFVVNSLQSGRRLNFWATLGFLWRLPTLMRLLLRLVRDRRVRAGSKVLLFGALLFIISPLDIPNFVPVLGELSDLMLALLACQWFVNFCQPAVVAEHVASIRGRATSAAVEAPAALCPSVVH
jgi:uncharacterized membrane protein YkvA (DUF1232 family)